MKRALSIGVSAATLLLFASCDVVFPRVNPVDPERVGPGLVIERIWLHPLACSGCNYDERIEPGERFELDYLLANIGQQDALDVEVWLTTATSCVTIFPPAFRVHFRVIAGTQGSPHEGPFVIQFSETECRSNDVVTFVFDIHDGDGHHWSWSNDVIVN